MLKTLEETSNEKKEAIGTKEKATDQMLQEAGNWLKKGIQKNYLVEIQLALVILNGSLALHNEQKKNLPVFKACRWQSRRRSSCL